MGEMGRKRGEGQHLLCDLVTGQPDNTVMLSKEHRTTLAPDLMVHVQAVTSSYCVFYFHIFVMQRLYLHSIMLTLNQEKIMENV